MPRQKPLVESAGLSAADTCGRAHISQPRGGTTDSTTSVPTDELEERARCAGAGSPRVGHGPSRGSSRAGRSAPTRRNESRRRLGPTRAPGAGPFDEDRAQLAAEHAGRAAGAWSVEEALFQGFFCSRPVSRILSWVTISLGRRLPGGSSGVPGPSAGRVDGTCFALHRTGFG